jgi:hypothetical protein
MHHYAHVITQDEQNETQRHSFRRFSTSKSFYKYIEHLREQDCDEEVQECDEFQVEQAMPCFYLTPMVDNGNGILCCYNEQRPMITSISDEQYEKRVYPVLNRANEANAIKKAKLKPGQSLLLEIENWLKFMKEDTFLVRTSATIPLCLKYDDGVRWGVEVTDAEDKILKENIKYPASCDDLRGLLIAVTRQRKLELLAA